MEIFSNAFQMLIGGELRLPVFLLMTGVYNNISKLKNNKKLTFLYRATRIPMMALSMTEIRDNFQEIFQVDTETAIKYAKTTQGYSLAYQCLGSVLWEAGSNPKWALILKKFDQMMGQYAYEKIWDELSEVDKNIVFHITSKKKTKINISELRMELGVTPQYINLYKKRLIERGIINDVSFNTIKLALPRFDKYIEEMAIFDE